VAHPYRVLLAAGTLAIAVSFCWQKRIGLHSRYLTAVLGSTALFAAGGALFFTPLTSVVASGVSETEAGAASRLMNTAKQADGALGLAALTTLPSPVQAAALPKPRQDRVRRAGFGSHERR
jgi:hypothetical protein